METKDTKDTRMTIIHELLSEFKIHRNAIMDMIADLEVIKKDVDRLFPEKLDARHVRFFEEKVKTITEVFKTLLDMRKEIQKSLKEELDLRRKIKDSGEDDDDVENYLDVRKLALKVDEFKEKRDKIAKQSIKTAQQETDEVASEIVQVTESG